MGYKSITGEALAEAVAAALPAGHIIKDKAKHVAPDHLLLARGGRLSAKHVIDARGAGKFPTLDCGWQKFVGQALPVKGGHGVEYPRSEERRVGKGGVSTCSYRGWEDI